MKNTNKKVTIKDNNNNQPLSNNLINTTGKSLSKHQTVLSQPKVFGNRVSSSQTINNNYKKASTKKQQGTPKTNKGSFVNNPMNSNYATTNPGIKRTTRLKQSSIVSSITGSVNYNHKSSIQSTDFSKTPFAGELKCSGTKVPDEEVLIVHVHNHTESNVTNKNHSKQTSPYLKKNKTKQIYNTAKGNTNSGGSSNTKSISNGLFVDNNNNNNNYVTKTRTTEEDDNSPTKVNNNALPTAQTFTEITQDNNNNNNVMLTNNNNVTTPKTSRVVSKEHNSFTNLGLITQTKSTPNLVNHTFNININNNNAVIIPSCNTNNNTNDNNNNNIYSHSNEMFLQKILEMFISLKPNISNNNEDILTELFQESQTKFKELENKINSIIITNSINHKQIQTQQDYINEIYLNSQTRIEIYKTYFEFIYNILNEIKYITTREINHDLILKQIDEVNSNTKSKLTNTCNVNESICEEKTNLILPMGGNIFLNNKQIVENELSEFISSIHSEFYQKLIFDDEKKKTKIYNCNNNNNVNHLDDTPLQYSKKNFFPKKKNSQKSCDSNDQTIKMSEDDYSSTIIRDDDSIKESIDNNNNKCIRKVNEIHPNQIINQVNINNQNRKQLMKYCNNNNNNTNACNQVGRNVKPPLQKGKTNDNNNNENNCNVF